MTAFGPSGSPERDTLTPRRAASISGANWRRALPAAISNIENNRTRHPRMANTSSARKATRQIARRTLVNKARRSRLRTAVVKIEEAIATGDRGRAQAALADAEPVIMRAAQKGIIHKNAASRKVSRLAHRVAKLGQ